MTYTTREIYANGKRGCAACLTITEYPNSVIVSAEDDKITQAQLRKALKKEFPKLVFYARFERGYIYAQADVYDG